MKKRFWFKKKNYPFTLSHRWQKLPYICNIFFYCNNLKIIFLNYRTIEKSPTIDGSHIQPSWRSYHMPKFFENYVSCGTFNDNLNWSKIKRRGKPSTMFIIGCAIIQLKIVGALSMLSKCTYRKGICTYFLWRVVKGGKSND